MSAGGRPRAILTDIEGTTTPISFVRDVLFPFARSRLAAFLEQHAGDPAVAEIVREVSGLVPGTPVAETLHAWMDADAKITPLKTLQGLIWEEGYRTGALVGDIYPDVPPVLRRWHAAGIALFVYSSGSRAAQLLIFGHSTAGDLRPLFSEFFDTGVGAKQSAGSYRAIAGATALIPEDFLFLSDNEAELDAAQAAGMAVLQLVRANDGTAPSRRHPTAPDFSAIAIG